MFTVSGMKRNPALFIIAVIAAIIATGAFFCAPAVGVASEIPNTQVSLVVTTDGGLVSIDAKDAEIAELLTDVAQKTKTNISIGAGVEGKITVKLSATTIEEVLRAISQNSAIVYQYLPETRSWRVLRALVVPGAKGKNAAAPGGNRQADAGSADRATAPPPGTGARKEGGSLGTPASGAPTAPPPPAGNHESRPAYKKGELLVKFKTEAAPEQIAALHARLESVVIKNLPKLRLQRIKLKTGLAEAEAIRQYQESPIVEHAERHALRYPQATPNDPGFPKQWGLKKIGAEALWGITTGNRDVIIAVIDSGVNYNHPDLRGNIWINTAELNGLPGVDDDGNGYIDDIYGWDFANLDVNGNGNNNPMDFYGHGTHVAGIIGAVGNNGGGVSGVNWKIRIMPLKVRTDSSGDFTDAAILEAIGYAIANGAQVVNCSFGGNTSSTAEYEAFARLREKGILAICAAGNYSDNMDADSTTKIYPASYDLDNIISVANSDSTDALASSSNYGKIEVDVAAPGNLIYSTLPLSASVRVVYSSPLIEYPAIGMEYAPLTSDSGITGPLYDCGMGYPDQIPAAVSGNIALIERGNSDGVAFYFSDKAKNAQAKGAAGIIFYNNVVDDFDLGGGTLGSSGTWVPAVSITKADGEALLSLLLSGGKRVTLINKPSANSYGYMSGTSMAAPHVAGLAGLIYGQCPSAGYTDVRASIINSVDKIPSLADKVASGGRINALAALTGLFPPGDLSGNCRIGLEDAIIALKLMANMDTSLVCPLSTPNCRIDINNDNLIGTDEVVYILQKISGSR